MNKTGSILFSKFTFWILLCAVGTWYMFPNLFKRETQNRFAMSHIGLGIDLQGGTYITLGLELEKVTENRLATESRSLEKLFKEKLKALPIKKDVKDQALTFTFSDEDSARSCYNLVSDVRKNLKTSLSEKTVTSTIAATDAARLTSDAQDQAIEVIRSRVDQFGVSGAMVQKHGSRQIVVQLPGVDDPDRVKSLLTKRAHLEFKMIMQEGGTKEALLEKFEGGLPSDLMIIPGEATKDVGEDETAGQWYLVSAYPDLTGDHITDARIGQDEFGRPLVNFKMDSEGATTFREITANNIGKRLGIIIDNVVFSAPSIKSVIPGGSGQISGNYTTKTASDLSLVLRTGSFQAPVIYQEERRIGPSLGQDSIYKGILSCLVGLALLFIFSLVIYGRGGLFASFALIYNLFLVLFFLSGFSGTLTLPGIAGMVLTIGMAIDASVLIYEQIRQELESGAPYSKAIDNGFSGAITVILDANITNFLTGLVLFYFGGPSVQGFAVTLMIGIIATILAGVFFLKSMLKFVLDLGGKPLNL